MIYEAGNSGTAAAYGTATSGTVLLVGLRRPFSPQVERQSEDLLMKKTKAAAEQPVGIVIATGSVAPSNPRVKAYFWCELPPQENEGAGE